MRFASCRALALAMLCLGAAGASRALEPADLQWDLSYASVRKAHAVSSNEWMHQWPAEKSLRPVHQKLAAYAGEPIEASVLIEMPDGHAGDAAATWFVKTRSGATMCDFHRKFMDRACKPLDPSRAEAFVREVMAMKPDLSKVSDANVIDKRPDGSPILLNYLGFVSTYLNGKATQRPLTVPEMSDDPSAQGARLRQAIDRLVMSPEDYAKRQAVLEQLALQRAAQDAARKGDVTKLTQLLDRGVGVESTGPALLKQAAGNGQKTVVDLLLQRGANVDADDGVALKAAVAANDRDMVLHLLSKGAKVNPSAVRSNVLFESSLSEAVKLRLHGMARLLIERGADVNVVLPQSLVATAAQRLDLEMVDLLLKAGANPDQPGRNNGLTALIVLMNHADRAVTAPEDKAKQNEILEREALIGSIVRRLVAAGADINYINALCTTPYTAAAYTGARVKELLVSLGADPQRHVQCQNDRAFRAKGRERGTEVRARDEVISKTSRLLKARDHAGMEELYRSLNSEAQRTPSGIWKLGLYYNQVRAFSQPTRDAAYWEQMEKHALQWQEQFPQSAVARIFQVYLRLNRLHAFRGDAAWAQVPEEDRKQVTLAVGQAMDLLKQAKGLARTDPEWYRAMIEVMPFAGQTGQRLLDQALEAAKHHPYYHETYFSAAFYLRPMWGGNNQQLEQLARRAAAATAANEQRAVYARVYWALDQSVYRGGVFKNTSADWAAMKNGFEDMVARYPDPWNLNAYAYFACQAEDNATLADVLKRVGKDLVFAAWGNKGEAGYMECARRVASS